ncbi:MAG TPA: PSD1 and planctomycete cytochrome C domain-containing protein [Gemmataceae bacterium]
MQRFVLPLCAVFVCSTPGRAAEPVDFAHDVLPLLKARCAECHTNGTYKGRVSFDTRAALLKSEAVVPGKAGESVLIERVSSNDPELRMPPKGPALTAKEVALLRAWIDQGVPWQEGFTFAKPVYAAPLKPRRPELPPARDGLTNPVDRIAAAYFEKHKLPPPPTLDDAAFVRRLYLDVIGLLPTPEEQDAFLADEAPDKRDRLIRRLLDDRQRYAEHWLTFWNDLLRNDYQGTGYIDGGRKQISGWLYRSLKENKPYDQFVRELIAPTPESEGFIKGIKWRGVVNASQVTELQFSQNISQVFLGINMKCASCHDSFIDRWKLEDAYGLAAVVADRPLEVHRCDKPLGVTAEARFLWPELGTIDPAKPREERLKKLAGLMTHPDNGRFTRTIVNRLWQRLMGRGIVHPVDVMANEPWSADLLDYLATDLAENGYDLKKTIERIVSSRAYQSQSVVLAEEPPSEDYVFAGPIAKRMTAEQFIDAVWRITGTAPAKPAFDTGDRGGEPVRASLVASGPLMRSLGRPNREQVVTTRPAELSTLQALDLTNGRELADLLDRGARNLRERHPDWNADRIIVWVYRSALCRPPTPEEAEVARQILGEPMTDEGLSDLLWAVFMLPEFQLVR